MHSGPVLVPVLYALFSLWILIAFDFREQPIRGDMSNHIMQALSLGFDGDLKYEARDEKHWLGLGWLRHPRGLFFQEYSGGHAFAKPYGYSLFLAPWVRFLGAKGCVAGNVVLFALLNLLSFAILRQGYSQRASVLLALTFTFCSCAYMYVFYIHSDLFLAVLVAAWAYGLMRVEARPNRALLMGLGLLTGFIIAEKLPAALVLVPAFVYVAFRRRAWWALLLPAVALFLASLPYLHYSDWQSWTPYAGTRFYTSANPPFFSGSYDIVHKPVDTAKFFSWDFIWDRLGDWASWKERVISTYYYFFGAHTGLLVFFPLLFFTLVLSVRRAVRTRDAQSSLILAGVFSYILFYTVLFTANYYGGSHSLGNRYFLQISPVLLIPLCRLDLGPSGIRRLAVCSLALSLAFLFHHHLRPHLAYVNFQKLGSVQRMMPYEMTQKSIRDNLWKAGKVNASLYPFFPRHYAYMGLRDIDGQRVALNVRGENELQKKPWRVPIWHGVRFDDGSLLLLRDGFYAPEGAYAEYAWARERAKLFLENTGREQTLVVGPGPVSNMTIVVTYGAYAFTESPPFAFTVDTGTFSGSWVSVHFAADGSAVPADTGGKESRRLSFPLLFDQDMVHQALEAGLVRLVSANPAPGARAQ